MEQAIEIISIIGMALAVILSPFVLWMLCGAADNWIEDHA